MDKIKKIANMKQEKINYSDIMSLGFTEEQCNDSIYFKQYGYSYCMIILNITKKIYLDWSKETQLCEMIRIGSPKNCNIKKRMPIKDLAHLKEIINFFSNKKEQKLDKQIN